jgi:hypothetical protein
LADAEGQARYRHATAPKRPFFNARQLSQKDKNWNPKSFYHWHRSGSNVNARGDTLITNSETATDNFTECNIQQCNGSLPENFKAIKTFAKKILTAFGRTYICKQAFPVSNILKRKF